MAARNPFSPTFGAPPPLLVGRDDIFNEIADSLAIGPTHPDYTSLLIGVRGAGKTVMLNAIEDLARTQGWLTIAEDATSPGLLDRIDAAATEMLAGYRDVSTRRISGITAGPVGVDFAVATDDPAPQSLRSTLTKLGDHLAEGDVGLMITLDELHSADLAEIRNFGAIIQHVTRREQRPIAFVGAALPQIEDTLLADDAATFLQRCSRYDIDRLSNDAVASALRAPVENRGGRISADGLAAAVEATSGYAFMVQLVGFHSWKAADDPAAGITTAEVTVGIAEAEQRIGRLILAPTWRSLSDVDRQFLVAMAQDAGESRLADVAERLDVTTNYAGVYRHRLISAGMITSTGKGRINFAHHTTRNWLRSQPAYTARTEG